MKKVLLIIVSLLMIVPVLPIRASVIKNDTEKKSLSQSDECGMMSQGQWIHGKKLV